MNEVTKQLTERKSVRVFTDQKIDEAAVEEILTCSTQAPTAGNQQLYSIIRVSSGELKEKLSEVCDHQPFIAEGKLVLVYCADCLKWHDAFRENGCEPRDPGEGDLILAIDDALIAAQNAVTAAWSLGIGSCYIGDIMENCEEVRSLLKLPEYVFPAALLVFGYPTEQQKERIKPKRAELKYIVSEDSYHRLSREELKQMLLKNCSEETYDNWIAAFCKRKYNSGFSREMTRSVREYLKQFKDGKGE
ncbi:MAG: nitroreductase family protein [Erysipelotrichaceae bacterium]|nr:nitroreductase family protein [Erysipelotrichaceae bacterium]MBQ1809984.1 nitroreductase family protein [Erysipelotrichaceae bacterium]